MNQDQIKDLLLKIEESTTEFSVTFTGKKSSLVNGLYKPLTREILIHNKNFENEQQLVYTAIHEYAHHLHCERKAFIPGARHHSNEFWSIFHDLLDKAETAGIYQNIFGQEKAFMDLTGRIREIMPKNGELMLQIGKLIVEAEELCRKHCVRFEDYLDRALGVPRTSASAAMKAFSFQVPADLGWDAMKLVSGIKKPDVRGAAIDAFRSGKSPEAVKALIKNDPSDDDIKERLAKERARLERTIQNLQQRLAMVEKELSAIAED